MQVGDKVKVKTWEQLIEEFGLHKDKHIVTPSGQTFPPMMRQFCGKKSYISEVHTDDGRVFYTLEGCSNWTFPEESVSKIK